MRVFRTQVLNTKGLYNVYINKNIYLYISCLTLYLHTVYNNNNII